MRQSLHSRKRVLTPFQKAILNLKPISYYPLDDSSYIAYDVMNRQNLIYPTVNVLRQPSILASGEGSSVLFNYADPQLVGNYNFTRFSIGGITRVNSNLRNRLFGVGLTVTNQRAELECLIGSVNFSSTGTNIVGHAAFVSFYNNNLVQLELGRSYFICMTYEPSVLRIYVNGILIIFVNVAGSTNVTAARQNTFYFGNEGGVPAGNLNLSNVFVCDYLITQSQINSIIGLI
jgi:hypothetical protein